MTQKELRKTERIPVTYIVYYHKGAIKVHAGKKCGVFYPFDTKTYMTKNPDVPMEMNSRGKVWCLHPEDIPEAKNMIREAYKDKLTDYREVSGAVIRNFRKVTEGEHEQSDY